jgi:hypothetical protein
VSDAGGDVASGRRSRRHDFFDLPLNCEQNVSRERQLRGKQSRALNVSEGSGPDSQSGKLAACLPSFELMTPVC